MSDWHQSELSFRTVGRGAVDITEIVNRAVAESGVQIGLSHVFLKHTSASLMLCENADSTVLHDMETVLKRLGPDADPEYLHDYEGDDDMAAHVRSVLTANDITIPVRGGQLNLGTWQGLFLYEHRFASHSRHFVVTVNGQ